MPNRKQYTKLMFVSFKTQNHLLSYFKVFFMASKHVNCDFRKTGNIRIETEPRVAV